MISDNRKRMAGIVGDIWAMMCDQYQQTLVITRETIKDSTRIEQEGEEELGRLCRLNYWIGVLVFKRGVITCFE